MSVGLSANLLDLINNVYDIVDRSTIEWRGRTGQNETKTTAKEEETTQPKYILKSNLSKLIYVQPASYICVTIWS